MKALLKFAAVIITLSLLMGCSQEFAPNPESLFDHGNASVLAMGGEEEEGAGNNLSFPVIWVEEDEALPLRGTMGKETFMGHFYDRGGEQWFVQKDEHNEWQAYNGPPKAFNLPDKVVVSYVDWGDNLEAKQWGTHAMVRVEARLYKTLPYDRKYVGYTMESLEGEKMNEVWGTNGLTFVSEEAMVFTRQVRLTIQKIEKPMPFAPKWPTDLHWDDDLGQWIGGSAVEKPIAKKVMAGVEGPGNLSAEVNGSGTVIYGYNWQLKQMNYPVGVYRITLSFTNDRVVFDDQTYLKAFAEEDAAEPVEVEGEDESHSLNIGGQPGLLYQGRDGVSLAYIDVLIEQHTPGGGGGGGGGHGGGGGNH